MLKRNINPIGYYKSIIPLHMHIAIYNKNSYIKDNGGALYVL